MTFNEVFLTDATFRLKGEVDMIRLKFTDKKLTEAYKIAEREGRTLLGVIYNEYIAPYFPTLNELNPRNIYANRKLVLKMIDLDKRLDKEGTDSIYLNYGPSTKEIVPMDEDEIIAVSQ